MVALNLTDKKYGRLTGVRRVENMHGYHQARWLFMCDCGKEVVTFGFNVTHGRTMSCGCWRKDHEPNLVHGKSGSPIHNAWVAMHQRCYNENGEFYSHYGGRGITVCDEWRDFSAFLRDMSPRPPGHSLDRIDNSKGYSADNCRWASNTQQVRNRRKTTFYEYEGKTLSLPEWAEQIGVKYQTLWHRYKIGKRGTDLLDPVTRQGGARSKGRPLQAGA